MYANNYLPKIHVCFYIMLGSFLCSSCTIAWPFFLKPRASYSSHRFQTAQTLGAGRTSLMPLAASVPNLELTQPQIPSLFGLRRIYPNAPLSPDYILTEQSLSALSPKTDASTTLLLGLNLQHGITPNLDIGVEAAASKLTFFGSDPLFSIASAQILAKYRFSAPTDEWSFASVGMLGYVWGADQMSMRNAEISIPISRILDNDFWGIHITPRLGWVQSQTPYSFNVAISRIPLDSLMRLTRPFPPASSLNYDSLSQSVMRTYTRDTTGKGIYVDNRIIPSLSVGAHIGRETQYHVEFGILLIDGRILPTGGLAIRFHF